MKFYHCFNTSLPDQFIEANSGQLVRWVEGWKTNPYLVRSRIIDGAQINLNGNAKRDAWPELGCGSTRMLDLWMQNKGVNYNGRYWESLAEDQRNPVRVASDPGGKDSLVSWITGSSRYSSALAQQNAAALTASQLNDVYRQMMQAAPSLSSLQASALRSAYLYGDFEPAPKPALKRDGIVAGEIVGYRCWKIQKGLLRSVYQKDIWLPGQVLEGRELGDWDSRGIHAWKDKGSKQYHDYIRSYLNQDGGRSIWYIDGTPATLRPAMVTGAVLLWGDVVEHERGWRAEFARVQSLDWLYPDETMMGREQEALAELRATYSLTSNQRTPQRE